MSRMAQSPEARPDPFPLVPLTRLRPRDGVTVVRTLGWYGLVRVALALGGFGAAVKLLRLRPVGDIERLPGPLPRIDPLVRRAARGAQRVMSVPLLRVTCIPRAVVLERTLTAHGIPADLVIGILVDRGFRAHAWLEIEGNVIGIDETGSKTWRTIARFRSARSDRLKARTT